eukprot:m.1577 g.1577  ORF g.1577 m.1577 type:complete len:326 (+) comp7278_c0_seq1:41-1018(+)
MLAAGRRYLALANKIRQISLCHSVMKIPQCQMLAFSTKSKSNKLPKRNYLTNLRRLARSLFPPPLPPPPPPSLPMKGTNGEEMSPHDQTRWEYVWNRLQHVERLLYIRGYSILRVMASVVVFVVLMFYIFRDRIRENVAGEVASVASRSLEHSTVVDRAERMSKGILVEILQDPNAKELAKEFVIDVITRPETKATVAAVLQEVLLDPGVRKRAFDLSRDVIGQLCQDPETREIMLGYMKELIEDDVTKAAVAEVFRDLMAQEYVQTYVADFFQGVIASDNVSGQAADLARTVTRDVVGDQQVQADTSEALWKALKYAVVPGWFS